jgi:adenylate kinase
MSLLDRALPEGIIVRILMVAPPGAGKGTQGTLIAAHFGIPHISSGDLLRDQVGRDTELGRNVRGYLARGELVPDDIVLEMVRLALVDVKARDKSGGHVLDGVPRTIGQARAIYGMARELDMTAHVALYLKADDEEVVRRLLARAAVEHRADDTEAVIRKRLALYHEVTHPILDWYDQRGILVSIDAMRAAEDVGREALAALEVLQNMVDQVPAEGRSSIDLTGLSAARPGLPPARFEFIAHAEVHLGQPVEIGPVIAGRRRVIPITGGHLQGPRLRGAVLAGGADWQLVGSEGTAIIDTRYLIRTEAGPVISIATHGFRHGPPKVLARLAAGEQVAPSDYSFRVAATLESGDPSLAWVNRTLFFAIAARHAASVSYDLYALA